MCARPTPVPESLPSPVGASPRLVPVPCSPSGRYQTASAVVSDASSSAVASTPLRLRLVPQPPRASTARPGSPRARTAALGRVASPPREDGPALPGQRVAPAPAASLSSLARPSPPPAPLQARGGVALPVEGRGGSEPPSSFAAHERPRPRLLRTGSARDRQAGCSAPLQRELRLCDDLLPHGIRAEVVAFRRDCRRLGMW
mmetsp:Transcript_16390/g.53085  ORF Transcript_16390/g.53085 Transcript_16390/m.53085 type:complete len:201 (+) Transcript_16390:1333-1935(+)